MAEKNSPTAQAHKDEHFISESLAKERVLIETQTQKKI